MKTDKIMIKYIRHSFCECSENEFNKRLQDCPNCTHENDICITCKGTMKSIKIENCR